MFLKTSEKIIGTLTKDGFQGFNPVSETVKAKLIVAGVSTADANTMQVAKFVSSKLVDRTDEDAGNGIPFTYKAVSLSTDTIYATQSLVPAIVETLLVDEDVPLVANRVGSYFVVESAETGV